MNSENSLKTYDDYKTAVRVDDAIFDRYDVFDAWTAERKRLINALTAMQDGLQKVIVEVDP